MYKEVILDGYTRSYILSSDGKIYSTNKYGAIKEIGSINKGYYTVVINKKNYMIHRLVAKYFVDGYEDGYVVDHIDGNKLNNHYSNLRWCTDKYNQEVRITQGNDGSGYGILGLDNAPMKLEWNGRLFYSKNSMAKELSEERGVTAKCLIKTITQTLKRNGTLYGRKINQQILS